MNIPEEAYSLAMSQGYIPSPRRVSAPELIGMKGETKAVPHWCSDALQPYFWQALGKALGWNEKTLKEAPHYFYDLILQGQSTDEFWKELIN